MFYKKKEEFKSMDSKLSGLDKVKDVTASLTTTGNRREDKDEATSRCRLCSV